MPYKTFVGFGFGPIQSGLMLLEAQASGTFERFVIAEILQDLVDATRRNSNRIVVNVAHSDGIEQRTLSDVEIYNPRIPEDRGHIARAIHAADEMATAIPSVQYYDSGDTSSIASLLARNLNPAKPQILYASENNNYAAEILGDRILSVSKRSDLMPFQVLNTVIGKMSGVIEDPSAISKLDLQTLTPEIPKAVLVESFNRILVSKPATAVQRGIDVFEEKEDLLPFEEAKLFGHNAIHALLGYLAAEKGYTVMSQIREDDAVMALGLRAFLDESGGPLLKKHGATGDPLFTESGYRTYAEDLLVRMTNPWLHDEVARICRDPRRKLGYDDRLIGTMREALKQGIIPSLLARGAAAAVRYLQKTEPEFSGTSARDVLLDIWKKDETDNFRHTCLDLIEEIS